MTEPPLIGKVLMVEILDFVQPLGNAYKLKKTKMTEFPLCRKGFASGISGFDEMVPPFDAPAVPGPGAASCRRQLR